MYVNELQFNIFVLPLRFVVGTSLLYAEKDVIDHQITDFSYKQKKNYVKAQCTDGVGLFGLLARSSIRVLSLKCKI